MAPCSATCHSLTHCATLCHSLTHAFNAGTMLFCCCCSTLPLLLFYLLELLVAISFPFVGSSAVTTLGRPWKYLCNGPLVPSYSSYLHMLHPYFFHSLTYACLVMMRLWRNKYDCMMIVFDDEGQWASGKRIYGKALFCFIPSWPLLIHWTLESDDYHDFHNH